VSQLLAYGWRSVRPVGGAIERPLAVKDRFAFASAWKQMQQITGTEAEGPGTIERKPAFVKRRQNYERVQGWKGSYNSLDFVCHPSYAWNLILMIKL